MTPVPLALAPAPHAAYGFQDFAALVGIAANPQPSAAQLDFNAFDTEQNIDDGAELLGRLGRSADIAARPIRLLVLHIAQNLENAVVLGVNRLHGRLIASHIGMVLHGELLVGGFEFVEVLAVVEVHFRLPSLLGLLLANQAAA